MADCCALCWAYPKTEMNKDQMAEAFTCQACGRLIYAEYIFQYFEEAHIAVIKNCQCFAAQQRELK